MKASAWRILKAGHSATAFTGEGARLFGGRWSNKGTPVIYTAGSASLAVLELLVHLSSHQILDAYQLCEVSFDKELVEVLSSADLPSNWRSDPAPPELKEIGDRWAARQSSAVLRVPSVIIDTELNYLLNPTHSDFSRIEIGPPKPFRFDPRLRK